MKDATKHKQYSLRSQSRAPSALTSLSSSSSPNRINTKPAYQRQRARARTGSVGPDIPGNTKRRGPANLEQRRQVRYLTRRHPHLNPNQIAKIVGCAYSAVAKILANTYGGGDAEPDAPPKDKDFLRKYRVRDENERVGLAVWVEHENETDSDDDRPIGRCIDVPNINEVPKETHLPSASLVIPKEHSAHEPNQADMEWVSRFFNSHTIGGLKLPTHVIREMVAAGFKKYTVLHMMRMYTHKLEVANYLATVLRVTQLERDVIAGLMVERRGWFFHELKQEEAE